MIFENKNCNKIESNSFSSRDTHRNSPHNAFFRSHTKFFKRFDVGFKVRSSMFEVIDSNDNLKKFGNFKTVQYETLHNFLPYND